MLLSVLRLAYWQARQIHSPAWTSPRAIDPRRHSSSSAALGQIALMKASFDPTVFGRGPELSSRQRSGVRRRAPAAADPLSSAPAPAAASHAPSASSAGAPCRPCRPAAGPTAPLPLAAAPSPAALADRPLSAAARLSSAAARSISSAASRTCPRCPAAASARTPRSPGRTCRGRCAPRAPSLGAPPALGRTPAAGAAIGAPLAACHLPTHSASRPWASGLPACRVSACCQGRFRTAAAKPYLYCRHSS